MARLPGPRRDARPVLRPRPSGRPRPVCGRSSPSCRGGWHRRACRMMVGGLLRMFAVLAPEGDWTMLARVYRHLKQTAAPSRDKISRLVAAGRPVRARHPADGDLRGRSASPHPLATQIPRRADHRAADLLPDPAQEPDRAGDRPAPGLRRRGLRAAAHRGRDQDRPALPSRPPDRADRLHRPLPRGHPADCNQLHGAALARRPALARPLRHDPWAAPRSGCRSSSAPRPRSAGPSGRICSATAPSPSWSTWRPRRSASPPTCSATPACRPPRSTTSTPRA